MKPFVTSFEQIGFARGLIEGQRELVLYLLTRKIEPMTDDLRTQIAQLSSPQLLLLSAALLDFTHTDDLVAWLQANPASH